jgi:Flp pilus assembly protein TadG
MKLLRHLFDSRRGGRVTRLLPGLSADRRGVTAMVFAISATAILGIVGLATEAGTWYVARAQAYNVAYSAAIAGALAGSAGGDADAAEAAASDLVTRSGYTSLAVTANKAGPSGDYADPWEVDVSVHFALTPLLAGVLTKLNVTQLVKDGATVTAKAVAAIRPVGPGCALSLVGDLIINQNQASGTCYYASNATGKTAVDIPSPDSVTILAFGITTAGDCTNCPTIFNGMLFADPLNGVPGFPSSPLIGGGDVSGNVLFRPNSSYQPPTALGQYSDLDNPNLLPDASKVMCPTGLTYTDASGNPYPDLSLVLDGATHCPNSTQHPTVTIADGGTLVASAGDATCVPTGDHPYCGYSNMNVTIPAGTVAMDGTGEGTYFFVNASLTVQAGATILCSTPALEGISNACASTAGEAGVTIVLSGDAGKVGALTIASGASANLSAPAVNAFDSRLNGILFYRRGQGPGPGAVPGVTPGAGESADFPGVNIADTSGNILLNGGMYFRDSHVYYAANTNPDLSLAPYCSVLVAGYLTLGFLGSTDSQSNPTQFAPGCDPIVFRTPMPSVQAARAVE